MLLLDGNLRRKRALAAAKDLIALVELLLPAAAGRRLDDHAAELGTPDPGQCRLPLVLAPDLQRVEEVRSACVHGDQVFVGGEGRVGDGGNNELLRTLWAAASR